jgi:beta-lactamase regulating signal transducer with metallopeptidase domain
VSPDSALLLVLIVLSAIFTILFIVALKVLAEMFTNCWLDASKCWFIPGLEVIPN